jgi:hypothetical protein
MALAAAEARAAAAEEELEVLRDALAASAPSNASNDNDLIKALERERDAALDARDAAEEARAKAERQLSQSIDSVKDGAKGALSQLQKDAKTNEAAAVKKAVEDVKVEAKKKIAAVKEKLKAVQDFAKKRDEECKAAEAKLAQSEAARTTALDDVKAQLRHAQTQRDDALRQARTPVAAPVLPQKGGDDARLRAALDALDNERDANARLRADFERYKRRSNKVLRGAKKPQGKDAGAAAADRAALVAADAAIAASRTSAAAQKQAQDAMTSAVKVAARLAHAKAAEAKRKARLAIQAAQKRPVAPPPAPATPEAPPAPSEEPEPAAGDGWGDDGAVDDPPPTPAPAPAVAPAGEGWDDDDDRPEAPGLVARMLDAEISLPFFRRGGGSS